jgi:hypothetical protein
MMTMSDVAAVRNDLDGVPETGAISLRGTPGEASMHMVMHCCGDCNHILTWADVDKAEAMFLIGALILAFDLGPRDVVDAVRNCDLLAAKPKGSC